MSVYRRGDDVFEQVLARGRARRWEAHFASEQAAVRSKAYRRRAGKSPTSGAWLAGGERVHFPDVEITRVRPDHEVVPARGFGFHLLVYSKRLQRYLGFIATETLGYKNAREWIVATGWTPGDAQRRRRESP
ncbi:MAG: hypothetical protein Q8S13_02685 [Dehalococcoidia bacterium]|nr:hypothetical protein [Dehalococcoidia bacterium]